MSERAEVSRMLEAGKLEEVAAVVYDELRRLAAAHMRKERGEHTLQPTALANEVYLRLAEGADIDWRNRAHFLAIAARSMRQILVEHARKRDALKRGGDRARVSLSDSTGDLAEDPIDVIDLDAALDELAKNQPRQAQVVELRFFAGLTNREAAETLRISTTTTDDDWQFARAWLRRRLAK
ncbi:MAG: ECF-type sigma factor [Planctomycetota bacterium]|jgi:RNA polymerase sigma factor (TIGR02999 family)